MTAFSTAYISLWRAMGSGGCWIARRPGTGNWTWDCFVCFAWQAMDEPPLLVAVNYAANQSQCYVQIPFDQFRGRNVRMQDLLNPIVYESKCDESRGLYLDLRAWGYHVFELRTVDSATGSTVSRGTARTP